MKKIISLVLALSMVLGLCATSFAGLSDIEGTKYAGAVEALVELGVVTGYPTGDYKPEKKVNRAELAKMLVVCMGLEEDAERATAQNVFADESLLNDFAWARGYVNTAAAAGMINGYPDGTFKPEKTVTYAEAVTMCLRALGYGNVMEQEGGVWPTNALLKATELELFDDVDYARSDDGANRGDIAILLWNMLRTPMWKITAENQGTGMTSTMSSIMLNVKFPNYVYFEDGLLDEVVIDDAEVAATVFFGYDDDGDPVELDGELLAGDLTRMVIGMEVSGLYNRKTETFLTLHCESTMIEGLVEELDEEEVTIDGKDYKLYVELTGVEADDYVVLVLDGRKVVAYKELPLGGTYVESLRKVQRLIGEDVIVMVNGEWLTSEDVEEGDVYTAITEFGATYYVVARERVEGSFESLTTGANTEDAYDVIEVDGKEYDVDPATLEVYEYDENDEESVVEVEALVDDESEYLDEDVELVLDYLGMVNRVHFGEVVEGPAEGDFYVLTSNGWYSERGSKGTRYFVDLYGVDGEDTFEFASNWDAERIEAVVGTGYYASMQEDENGEAGAAPIFVAVKLNKSGRIEEMELLAGFDGFEETAEFATVSNQYLVENYLEASRDVNPLTKANKVTSSTVVFTAVPVIEDDEVVGVEVTITEGAEALEGIEVLYAVKAAEGEDVERKVSFAFVADDAKSEELNFGLVSAFDNRRGQERVKVDGTWYVIDEITSVKTGETVYVNDDLVGCGIAYTENEDGIVIVEVLDGADLAGAARVEEIEDEFLTLVGVDNDLDLSDDDQVLAGELTVKDAEDHMIVLVDVSEDEEANVVLDAYEVLGTGLNANNLRKHDYIAISDEADVIVILRGINGKCAIDPETGKVVDVE